MAEGTEKSRLVIQILESSTQNKQLEAMKIIEIMEEVVKEEKSRWSGTVLGTTKFTCMRTGKRSSPERESN